MLKNNEIRKSDWVGACKAFNQVAAGITFLCSLAIGTRFSMLIGTGVLIAVLLFYKGE